MNRLNGYLVLVLIAICLSFCGCSQASQIENLSYVVVMGLDRTNDNSIQLTVQIPKISGTGEESKSGSAGGNYINISVTAADFESALERLDWASPRKLNLAQLKLIVISRNLAESADFDDILRNIAQTERLYTATKLAVCEGSAKEFVTSIQPTIGTRISADINAIFEHYNKRGYIPDSSLAELYYQTESIYSDPMAAWAILDKNKAAENESESKPASAFSGTPEKLSSEYESDIPTRYLGAALFSGGRMAGILNGKQCIMANLLRNELSNMRYACDGQSLTIVPARPVYIKIDTKSNPLQINIDAKLAIAAQERMPEEETLRKALKNDILETIQTAQELKTEPFGFAQKASKYFLTLDDWLDFDWKTRFSEAQFQIELSFARSDT